MSNVASKTPARIMGSKAKGCTVYQFCMPGHPCPNHSGRPLIARYGKLVNGQFEERGQIRA